MQISEIVKLIADNGIMIVLSSLLVIFLYSFFNKLIQGLDAIINKALVNIGEIKTTQLNIEKDIVDIKEEVKKTNNVNNTLLSHIEVQKELDRITKEHLKEGVSNISNYREVLQLLSRQIQQNLDDNREIKDILLEHEKNTMLVREMIKDLMNNLKEE